MDEPQLLQLQLAVQLIAKGRTQAEENTLLDALAQLLQDKLEGNRMVSPNAWAVVVAMGHAFPLKLSRDIEQATAEQQKSDFKLHLWMRYALASGSLSYFFSKLPSQPQIVTAYANNAVARSKPAMERVAQLLEPLQGSSWETQTEHGHVTTAQAHQHPVPESGADGSVRSGAESEPAEPGHPTQPVIDIETEEDAIKRRDEAAAAKHKHMRLGGRWGSIGSIVQGTASGTWPPPQAATAPGSADTPNQGPPAEGEQGGGTTETPPTTAGAEGTSQGYAWGGLSSWMPARWRAGQGDATAAEPPAATSAAGTSSGGVIGAEQQGILQQAPIPAAPHEPEGLSVELVVAAADTQAPAGSKGGGSGSAEVQLRIHYAGTPPIAGGVSESARPSWVAGSYNWLTQAATAAGGSMPALPTLPPLPALPTLPTLPSLPALPSLPSLPSLAAMPATSTLAVRASSAVTAASSAFPGWKRFSQPPAGQGTSMAQASQASLQPPAVPSGLHSHPHQAEACKEGEEGEEEEGGLSMLDDLKDVLLMGGAGGSMQSPTTHPQDAALGRLNSSLTAAGSAPGSKQASFHTAPSQGGNGCDSASNEAGGGETNVMPVETAAAAGAPPEHLHTSPCTPSGHLGMTLKLVVDLPHKASDGELWERQSGVCAGCRDPLPPLPKATTTWLGFPSAAGTNLKGPRRCHYTTALYCTSCHHNQLCHIPALVLHQWDLAPQPVCCAAAEFLQTVARQPLLCVPAVNPNLPRRAPLLASLHKLRLQATSDLSAALAAGGTPALRAQRLMEAAGPRAYMLSPRLEDFWAMSDLAEVSKGALSQLPAWLEGVSQQAAALARVVGGAPPGQH